MIGTKIIRSKTGSPRWQFKIDTKDGDLGWRYKMEIHDGDPR